MATDRLGVTVSKEERMAWHVGNVSVVTGAASGTFSACFAWSFGQRIEEFECGLIGQGLF